MSRYILELKRNPKVLFINENELNLQRNKKEDPFVKSVVDLGNAENREPKREALEECGCQENEKPVVINVDEIDVDLGHEHLTTEMKIPQWMLNMTPEQEKALDDVLKKQKERREAMTVQQKQEDDKEKIVMNLVSKVHLTPEEQDELDSLLSEAVKTETRVLMKMLDKMNDKFDFFDGVEKEGSSVVLTKDNVGQVRVFLKLNKQGNDVLQCIWTNLFDETIATGMISLEESPETIFKTLVKALEEEL